VDGAATSQDAVAAWGFRFLALWLSKSKELAIQQREFVTRIENEIRGLPGYGYANDHNVVLLRFQGHLEAHRRERSFESKGFNRVD
jgi:hypothetical protein